MQCVYNEKIIRPSVEKKCMVRHLSNDRQQKSGGKKARNRQRLGQKSKAHYTLMKLTKFKPYIMERKMLIVVGFIVIKTVGRNGGEQKNKCK